LKSVCVYNLGQRKESLDTLSRIDLKEISPQMRPQVFPFWGRVASEEGRIMESTLAFVKARKEALQTQTQLDYEKIIQEQIENQLNEKELEFVMNEYPSEFPAALVQMRLVAIKLSNGERDQAQALLQAVIAGTQPGSPLNTKAAQMLSRINSVSEVQNKKVGFLLPLSGDRKALGQAFLDGLELALKGLEPKPFEIVKADTGPTLETAKAAFERLVFEDKVMVVVGPMLRNSADWIAEKSVEYGIPHIALSGKPGLLEKGNYVFSMALTPERQIKTLVTHAVKKMGAKRFAILFPEDSFGKDVGTHFFKAVEDNGGVVTAADSYDPDEKDFRIPVENMVGKAFPGFRKKESEENLLKFEEKFARKPTNKEADSMALSPIVDFDVLFIPDKYKTVGQIVPTLAYTEIAGVQFMGPSTWNNKDLLKRSGSFLERSVFVDSLSLDRKSRVTREFVEKYKIDKGRLPSSVSALGYDLALAMRNIFGTKSYPQSREELRKNLEVLGTFDGAQGVYTFDDRRDALTEVQLFEIRRNEFVHQGGILTQ
jgi:ABC-type branched-subunit amino acid transport system substrate-binding protein